MNNNKVFIISGPAGVGKTTTSKELARQLDRSAYVSGDNVSHMHINGRKKPWESKEESSLIWDNILSLTKNFLKYENDVVIDYISFPKEVEWLKNQLRDFSVQVHYVVLWADNETILKRDKQRKPEHQMKERCIILVEEFTAAQVEERFKFDTRESPPISEVVKVIINNPKFIWE